VSEASPSVEERLQFMEEQIEAYKRSGLLLVILVLVMGGTMIYQSRVMSTSIQTDGLIISSTGKPRGAITAMPTGHLGVLFYNHEGLLPERAQYESIPYLDGFAIYDRAGRPRILIGMDERDNPVLRAFGSDGKTLFSGVPDAPAPANEGAAQPDVTPSPAATATPQP
jgi:hypothetical protein